MKPELICHADWSMNPRKRWSAEATVDTRGIWIVAAAALVGDTAKFGDRLRLCARTGGSALAGFDFPIGFPCHYAKQANITDFKKWLTRLGRDQWKRFGEVCDGPEEILISRPFYPRVPRKGVKKDSLIRAHNAKHAEDLLRLCERGGDGMPTACSIFWTLGAKQVGRAALAGWEEVIIPLLRDRPDGTYLWPFDGALNDLLKPGKVVLAETYPANNYSWFSQDRLVKSEQTSRREFGRHLLRWAGEHGTRVTLSDALEEQINVGFANDDAFDAIVGLFAMLKIIFGEHSVGEPIKPECRTVEGWMLGRHQPAVP